MHYICIYFIIILYYIILFYICIIYAFIYAFLSRTTTTHAESINSDLQPFTTHTTLNTEQNQLAIKVSADN